MRSAFCPHPGPLPLGEGKGAGNVSFLLCHSRVGGNPVFTEFTPAHGVGGFRAYAGMPAFRGTGPWLVYGPPGFPFARE